MTFDSVHCLFEQSGTFKNEFIKLGFHAADYDIRNDFSCTDYQIDIFNEVLHPGSLFNSFSSSDLLLAFFPCVRFETQIKMFFRGVSNAQSSWSDSRKITYAESLHSELSDLYSIFCKFFSLLLDLNLRCIIENPWSPDHYLTNYFPVPATIIDHDRRKSGDFYKKPTQYWFVNCSPSSNFVTDALVYNSSFPIVHVSGPGRSVQRSMISSDYAARFIKEFIL